MTECIIGRKTNEGFIGTFQHLNGHPEGVGQLVAQGFKNGGWNYLNTVLAHSWQSLLYNECQCCDTKADVGEDSGEINQYVHDYGKERFVPYTHETDCEAVIAYVFEHDTEKKTDFMNIYLKARPDEERRHVVDTFSSLAEAISNGPTLQMTTEAGEWKIGKTIDLGLELPDFEELGDSLWETRKSLWEKKKEIKGQFTGSLAEVLAYQNALSVFESYPFLKHTYDKLPGDVQTLFDALSKSPIDRELVIDFFHWATTNLSDEQLGEDTFHIDLINDLFDQDETSVEVKESLKGLGFTPEILQLAHKAINKALPGPMFGISSPAIIPPPPPDKQESTSQSKVMEYIKEEEAQE